MSVHSQMSKTTQSAYSFHKINKTILLLTIIIGIWSSSFVLLSCQEASMECLSKYDCDPSLTCVAGRCVDVYVEGDPFELYASEMHARLVSECGVCHAAAEEGMPAPTPEANDDAELMITSDNPFALPTYSVALGDSGWRIYTNNLTPERLRASYQDTLQYLNPKSPKDSLLFAYGRGDLRISLNLTHPKLYPREDELGMSVEMTEGADYIGYQRLISWAQLEHSPTDGAVSYDVEKYKELFQQSFGLCGGCHPGDPINNADSMNIKGGYSLKVNVESPEDLVSLTPLINFEDPANSSLIRVMYGEFDHINLFNPMNPDRYEAYTAAAVQWIETLKP